MSDLKELEAKYKEIGEEIERLKREGEKSERWVPKDGETYSTINFYGASNDYTWNNDPIGKKLCESYNIWPTKQAAKAQALRIKILNILWSYADGDECFVSLMYGDVVINSRAGLMPGYSTIERAKYVSDLVKPLFEELKEMG